MEDNETPVATGPDLSRPVAAGHDLSRQATTDTDNDYILTAEQAAERYNRAGHPRTLRAIQRYCANGHLDAQKIATATGDKYLITPQSVSRHLAQIAELALLDAATTGPDLSRPVAAGHDLSRQATTDVAPPVGPEEQGHFAEEPAATSSDAPRQEATTGDDKPRQAATPMADLSRDVGRLETQLEQARDERDFLREQIDRKDKTIDALIERDRETNFLVRGLQDMLTPLLGGARRHDAHNDNPPPMSG